MSDQRSSIVRFDVLGELAATRAGVDLRLGPTQQRVVLAVLLLHANKRVGREQLIDAVWGEAVPTYSVNLVQKHISALRRILDPQRPEGAPSTLLSWTDSGYRLDVLPGGLDLEDFERSVRAARQFRSVGDFHAALAALDTAAAQWRGPLADGLSSPLIDAERDRLNEQRIGVLEDRADVRLALGMSAELVDELRRLATEHPLRERLRLLLMLSLYRAGRQAEALDEYRQVDRLLRNELGVEPGPSLRTLHQKILAADPGLVGDAAVHDDGTAAGLIQVAAADHPAQGKPSVPAQLPPGPAEFVGRERELVDLNSLIDRSVHGASTIAITAIAGTAGVGKTALALHWAHQIRHRFPDGQMYVNLRGFEPTGAAMEPAEAIRAFLDGLGVPTHQIPVSFESQAALYRSVLADRRVQIGRASCRESV